MPAIPALALALDPSVALGGVRAFAALRLRGGQVLEAVDSEDHAWLRERGGSQPVVTDDPLLAAAALRQAGISRLPPVWSVLDLAGLVAPEAPTDSLDETARFFGLVREEEGIEGNVRLVAGLFGRLLEELDRLNPTVIAHVNRLAAPLEWPLKHLFKEVERARARQMLEQGTAVSGAAFLPSLPPKKRTPLVAKNRPGPLDVDEVVALLGPKGRLAAEMPGYEARDEQMAMARAVADGLNDGSRLLVEAGTGTGKSVAYLLPAAKLALQNGWRVVVSTATTTLQDQLYQKDLPIVEATLGAAGELRATVLKGRGNYLCLRRWQALLQAAETQSADRSLLIKTLFWLPRTETGDRAELHLSAAEDEAWQRLSAVAEACTPSRCGFHKLGMCYLARARRAAEESHVVVVNHALLLSDLARGNRVLPDYQLLVVDEAHHLEDEATNQLGWRTLERELINRLDALWSPSSGARGPAGAIPQALDALRKAGNGGGQRAAEMAPEVQACETTIVEVTRSIHTFFGRLLGLFEDSDTGSDDGTLTLRVTRALRSGTSWEEVEEIWADAMRRLPTALRVASELQGRLEELPGAGDDIRGLALELASQLDFWREVRTRMEAAVHNPDPGSVYWISGPRRGPVWLSEAPIEVADRLRSELFAEPRAVVLVSATLAVDGSFEYVKRRLGLEDADALSVGSPFDYRRAAVLYVPHDVPDPTQPGYQALLQQVVYETVVKARGRTLVLFTSKAQLKATHRALAEPLASVGITLLAQGVNEASRTRLLEAFRNGSRVALLGTNSFWEGIDVVGEALSCLVVARLPFAVPTDPVYAARAELFDDPFGQFAVPQAVLRFKQGFGRLIRSRSDRGVVVVLDRRLLTRGYGTVFVRSLPKCAVQQGPASRTGRIVEEWLAGTSAASLKKATQLV